MVITGLLIIAFIPVFSSYKGDAIDKVKAIKETYKTQSAQISTLECAITDETKEKKEATYLQIETIKNTYKTQTDQIVSDNFKDSINTVTSLGL